MTDRHFVKIEDTRLHELYHQNAELRLFLESVLDPEQYGHAVKAQVNDLFKHALRVRDKLNGK